MKKLLVLTAALTLLAVPAFASIVNTGHDLSGKGIGTTEICVFCHTPHGAKTDTTNSFPLGNLAATSGSAICNTCHDGTVAYADMQNPPNGTTPGTTLDFTATKPQAVITTGMHHPVSGTFTPAANGAMLIGSADYTLSCSSCHDVHEPAFAPFLKMTNDKSALCLSCHNK